MSKIISIFLSFIFWILTYFAVAIVVVSYIIISIFNKNPKIIDKLTKYWSRTVIFLLKIILRIDCKMIDAENIPQEACIIACKHQSMWETIIFHLICEKVSYIYKKELLKIPLYGWYIKKMPSIQIDRNGGAKALKDMLKKTKRRLDENYKIIIFPQGTRVPVNSSAKDYPYQVGVAAIYSSCKVKVVPAALNSGQFWGKGMWIKKSGTIKIQFLKPIEAGLSKDEFMQKLENEIEAASFELSKNKKV